MKKEGVQEILQIGLPNMGVYGKFWKRTVEQALKKIGVNHIKLIISPTTTRRTINRGAQHMDENMCLPAKITLGNILDLHDTGCHTIIEWDNCGDCRQKTYAIIHQSTLRQLGIDAEIITIRPGNMIQWLEKILPNISKGQQKQVIREILREMWKFDSEIMERQSNPPDDQPKIGLCGEIYTVLEPSANLGLIKRLEEQGAFVHNALPLSQFLFDDLFKGEKKWKWAAKLTYMEMYREVFDWCIKELRRPDVNHELFAQAEKETEKYFPEHKIGGHGKQSVTWAIYYALAGYDGVVHVLPFPCMPEATVTVLMDEVSKDYGIPVNHLVFDQQFGEQNVITRAEAMVNILRFRREGLEKTLAKRSKGAWLGFDVGSTSTKAVLLNGETLEILDQEYQFTNRKPIDAIKATFNAIMERNPDVTIAGGATTGSGRRLAASLLDAPLAVDEISCQVIGSMLDNPNVRSIIEIGGQDSKFISLDESGVPTWFNMNSICSAGTGAFLSSAAQEFKIPIEKLGACARSADCTVSITGRCGVFAQSDIVSKQQSGYPASAIIKGTCNALAQNYLSNVCRSKALAEPIVFTGAVALNEGVVDAFAEETGKEINVHQHQKISGALGAAFIALARNAVGGFDEVSAETSFDSYTFTCKDCSNACEVSLICRDGNVVCALSCKCGKYEKYAGQRLDSVKARIGK